MIISSIVAVAKNNVIGKDNDMPWHLPADLAYFKKTTQGHHIILGRKNFEAIGRPLPKRTNVIVTRNKAFACSNCEVVYSVEEAMDVAKTNKESEAFIIGGGTIYEQSKAYWQRLYLTEIDLEVEGDVYFPELNWSEWNLVFEKKHTKDEKNPYDYTFKVFEKKAFSEAK
jgi:dihydrofolate reductase